MPANGAVEGSPSGDAGVSSAPYARSTATPSRETGAGVPLVMRMVTRSAGPAMLPAP